VHLSVCIRNSRYTYTLFSFQSSLAVTEHEVPTCVDVLYYCMCLDFHTNTGYWTYYAYPFSPWS